MLVEIVMPVQLMVGSGCDEENMLFLFESGFIGPMVPPFAREYPYKSVAKQ